MVRIKVCGITRLEDALEAASLGADALGFVFYRKSPRFIETRQAAEIIEKLPPFIKTVGLFVNANMETILRTINECPVDIIQLHGSESPEFCAAMPRMVIKAFRVQSKDSIASLNDYSGSVRAILLDAYSKTSPGGTGQTFNWDVIPDNLPNLILAGGLKPQNIADAVKRVRPYAIDASSGLESAPGIKSHEKMRGFFSAIPRS